MDFSSNQFLPHQRYFCFSWSLKGPHKQACQVHCYNFQSIVNTGWQRRVAVAAATKQQQQQQQQQQETGYADVINFASNT